jgi:hypothetical protein
MKDDAIKEAIAEAERFLKKARQIGKDDVQQMFENPFAMEGESKWSYHKVKGTSPTTSAAIRRSSLDLTKALAKMRQS